MTRQELVDFRYMATGIVTRLLGKPRFLGLFSKLSSIPYPAALASLLWLGFEFSASRSFSESEINFC